MRSLLLLACFLIFAGISTECSAGWPYGSTYDAGVRYNPANYRVAPTYSPWPYRPPVAYPYAYRRPVVYPYPRFYATPPGFYDSGVRYNPWYYTNPVQRAYMIKSGRIPPIYHY